MLCFTLFDYLSLKNLFYVLLKSVLFMKVSLEDVVLKFILLFSSRSAKIHSGSLGPPKVLNLKKFFPKGLSIIVSSAQYKNFL